MIILELIDEEALAFRLFREHQDSFVAMLKAGVFETKNGQIILNFNSEGVLTEIRDNVVRYKRGLSTVVSPPQQSV